MNLDIVIIGQNEEESIEKMLSSLKTYLPKARRIWVSDRSTDSTVSMLTDNSEEVHETPPHWIGRRVSSARNFGLSFTRNDADVIFLDGDRYIKKFCRGFLTTDKDILLFPVEKDERIDPKWFKKYSQIYGHLHNGFYSCGLYMKRHAIDKVLKFQGELFNTKIEQYWGIEDVHLGDVCYHLGLTCDFYKKVVLNGKFDSTKKIPLEAWRARVKERLPLNVIW